MCFFLGTFSLNFFLIRNYSIFDRTKPRKRDRNILVVKLCAWPDLLFSVSCMNYDKFVVGFDWHCTLLLLHLLLQFRQFQLIFTRQTNLLLTVIFFLCRHNFIFHCCLLVAMMLHLVFRIDACQRICIAWHIMWSPVCMCVCVFLHWNASNMTQRLLIIIEGRNACCRSIEQFHKWNCNKEQRWKILQVKRGHRFKSLSIRVIAWSRHFSALFGAIEHSLHTQNKKKQTAETNAAIKHFMVLRRHSNKKNAVILCMLQHKTSDWENIVCLICFGCCTMWIACLCYLFALPHIFDAVRKINVLNFRAIKNATTAC